MTARKGRESGLLPLLALTLMINVLGTVTEKGYNNTDHINTKSLVPLHPLSNIEITKYFNYNPRFNDVFSRENLPTIKDGAYAINLNDKQSKGTRWVSLFIDRNTAVYFDSLGIKCISKEVLNKIKDKSITHNISRR